jgi:outer membrane receptor for ferrienterochelin and colicin
MPARAHADVGLRWDHLSGFTGGQQLDPILNFIYTGSPDTTLHAGVARDF